MDDNYYMKQALIEARKASEEEKCPLAQSLYAKTVL